MTVTSYMKLPYDLSGSISKNRFRNEMLWGLKKILELYQDDEEFTVVFDYKCDIEVHFSNRFEFYQLKSQNNNGSYTILDLIKKNKSGDSVLGKLYVLKYDENGNEQDETLLAVVSNAPLNDGKKVHNNCESIKLSDIDDEAVKKLVTSVTKELSLKSDIKLANTYFVRTSIDLIDPHKTLIGELSLFFETVFNTEAKKINSLYRVLNSEITTRASYELKLEKYEDILKKKGINRSDLSKVLKKYIDNTDTAIIKAKDYIERHYSVFNIRCELKKALNQILIEIPTNNNMKMLEQLISNYIASNMDILPDDDYDIVEKINDSLISNKPIEMTEYEFKTLVIFTLKRYEEPFL